MLIIKTGDTRNAITATLNKNGQPVDLTGCHVLFYMQGKVNGGHCQFLDAENGKVFYPLEESAVNKSGYFHYEFVVQHEDGRQETFPHDSYLKLRIMDSLKE